jgi:Arf-GAP with GTPase, ANK repeat and PH domain-containing protein 1/3/4/5/6/9/11
LLVLINGGTESSAARIDVNSKKRHRRVKSSHKSSSENNGDEQEGFEFMILSLDNKQWHFEAASNEERQEWVNAIESQILSSLQLNETNKLKSKTGGLNADNVNILKMKNVAGNSECADCDAINPTWASLNLGALICIDCCGIHRNLGTHLSRVRSLGLDDWSNELVLLMTSIGNKLINSIYEANWKQSYSKWKPNPSSSHEEKDKWIRNKYESKQFLAPLPNKEISVGKQLIEAVSKQDIHSILLCLAYSKPDDVNCCVSQIDKRTSLHIAAAQGNIVVIQLLIWYGANVDITDNQGYNPLKYAKNANSAECCQLLIHHGSKDNQQPLPLSTQQPNLLLTKKASPNSAKSIIPPPPPTTATTTTNNNQTRKSLSSNSATSYIGISTSSSSSSSSTSNHKKNLNLNDKSNNSNDYDKLTHVV